MGILEVARLCMEDIDRFLIEVHVLPGFLLAAFLSAKLRRRSVASARVYQPERQRVSSPHRRLDNASSENLAEYLQGFIESWRSPSLG